MDEHVISDKIIPPWTQEQVDALNHWQKSPYVHPFTCGTCRDSLGIYFYIDPETEELLPAPDEWSSEKRLQMIAAGVGFRILDRELVATKDGWICPTCDYTQNWAHTMMLKDLTSLFTSVLGIPNDNTDTST